ncbi:MAG: peptidoglycan DD-metalloendopeptidase family protein [Candidatus Nanopelagicales bacterium]|nr:peptidoglycan DD-metalloendopeptidase family protein [Candidatus Nanopelagicales bacterium]MCF8550560.1 peptidoglycan DD-metalloendopeptidase family protein [Candidatus Nanopelagicales bacterium]
MRTPRIRLLSLLVGVILALGTAGASPATDQKWRYPVAGASWRDVVRAFSAPDPVSHRGHRGVDFPAEPGTPVFAVGSGTVRFAGTLAGKGAVSIDHGIHPALSPLAVRTTYEPVHAVVTTGDHITAGQLIGYTIRGNSHCSDSCLHLGLKLGPDSYLDPLVLWRRVSSLVPSARG